MHLFIIHIIENPTDSTYKAYSTYKNDFPSYMFQWLTTIVKE